MAVKQEQINKIVPLLVHDRASNFYQIQAYLRIILSGNSVEFVVSPTETITLSPQDAWDVISKWGATPEANLPIGERGSIKTLAGRLLGYIETNLVSKTSEAASAYYAMLDQAKTPLAPVANPSPELDSYQKANALRKQLTDAINAKFLSKLTTELEQSRYLQRITDVHTRSMVAAFLAANAANLRKADEFLPEKINQMLLSRAGDKEVNKAIHLLYSQIVHDQKDLEQITEIVDKQITATYKTDQEFIDDQRNLRSIASLAPSLDNIATLIDRVAPNATAKQKQILSTALRKEIVLAARGQHTLGATILSKAFYQAKLTGDPSSLSILNPIIEELETSTRHKLLGSGIRDRDSRVLSTYNLAARAGVDPIIPWTKKKDLQAIESKLLDNTSYTDINQALLGEYGNENRDPDRIAEINDLISLKKQYNDYHQLVSDNPIFAIRNLWAKGRGTIAAGTEPYQKVLHKAYSAFEKVDDVINWPARTMVNGWEKLVEKSTFPIGKSGFRFALLDPVGSIYKWWVELQKGYASRIATWANGLGGAGKWYSGFFRQVGDFSSSFVKADGNWSRANFLFFEKKWGNLLNHTKEWTAKNVFKLGSWAELKLAAGKLIQKAGNKFAAGLGDKILTAIGAATSEAGIGLLILGAQVIWEVGKSIAGKVKNFLYSIFQGDSKNLYGVIPLALGSLFAFLGIVSAGIIPAILVGLEVLKFLIRKAWEYLLGILALALLITIISVTVAVILFNAVNTTIKLDSGPASLIASAICEQSTLSNPSPTANVALCIAEIVNKCSLNPITEDKLGNPSWQCFVGGLVFQNAIAEIEKSAHVKNGASSPRGNLQCVGLSAAAAADGDGAFSTGQINACSYATNVPNGYHYLPGCPNMQPGDHFVMGADNCWSPSSNPNGTVGHIGVVIEPDGGAGFTCVDANYSFPGSPTQPGEVRGPESCHFVMSQISGCLRKM